MKLVLVALLLLLVGCSADEPGETPETTGPSSTASGSSTTDPTPSTPDPSESTTGSSGEVESFAFYVRVSDAGTDAQAVSRCATRDPAAPRCFAQVEGLALSAKAIAGHFTQLGTPPAELAELAPKTTAAATAAYEAAEAYVAACPEGAATSEQCEADLLALADGPGQALAAVIKEWQPFV